MDQEIQTATGRESFDSRGFCRATIGKEEEFGAALFDDCDWRGDLEQLGTIEFRGTKLTSAIVHLERWAAKIEFSNTPEFRAVRSRCQAIAAGPLPVCRLSRTRGLSIDNREVTVYLIFAGEQKHVPGGLHFDVNNSVASQANWTGSPENFPKELIRSLSFATGKGRVLLARFSGILGDSLEGPGDQVEMLNSEGDTVVCRIHRGIASGWIEVIAYRSRKKSGNADRKKNTWRVSTVRLLGFDKEPLFDPDRKGGELLALEALTTKGSTFLGFWRRYRELLKVMAEESFAQRQKSLLSFRVGIPDPEDPSCHRVNIANWHDCRDDWGDVKDASVYVARNQVDLGDENCRHKVTLVDVNQNGDARIRWNNVMPLDQGLIMVAEDSNKNDWQVADAITRLQQGVSVLPDLMGLLNDPSVVPAPSKVSPPLTGSIPFDNSQKEAIYKALGNRSIVAIQGPPGTGKTQVIVAIVRQLYQKSRTVTSSDGQAPFRVLISSAQNVAVFNAVDHLKNEGILIDQRLAEKVRQLPENAARVVDMYGRAVEISQSVRRRLEVEPLLRFQAQQARAVEQLLRALTEAEHSESVAAPLRDTLDAFRASTDALPLELMSLIQRHENQLTPALPSKLGTIESNACLEQVRNFLKHCFSAEPTAEMLAMIEGLEPDFDELGLSVDFEILAGRIRDHCRATRTRDHERISALRAEIHGMATSIHASLATHNIDPELENQANQETLARSILAELKQELSGYLRLLSRQKGGVLARWSQALEEQPGLWKELVEKYAEVRGATCQMAAPSKNKDMLRISDTRYDLVVIDEAARTDPGELLIPLTLGERLLLVGDQNQLPPYIDKLAERRLEMEDASGIDLLREQSFFQELFESLPESNKVVLHRQYRSNPIIGDAVSRAFYGGILKSGPFLPTDFAEWAAGKVPTWGLLENHPLCWVDTDLMAPRPLCKTLNPDESDLAVEIVERVLASLDSHKKHIGLITFYREQLNHLHAKLELAVPNHTRLLELNTVDSFQGKEFPLVILLTSRRDPDCGRIGFLNLPNRVNVAVSRAQRQLVILGSRKTLLHSSQGSDPFKAFVRAAGANLKLADPLLKLLKP